MVGRKWENDVLFESFASLQGEGEGRGARVIESRTT